MSRSTLLRLSGLFALAGLMMMPLHAVHAQPTVPAPKLDTWYVQNSMLGLGAATRFVGGLVVSNPSASTVYVRTSVDRVAIVGGERRRLPVDNDVLRIYPEEFVLRPGDSFTARVVASPGAMPADSQSFYVKFTDISNTKSDAGSPTGMQNAYLLAFESWVTVNRTPISRLTTDQFALGREGDNYTLKNLSGRHLYLDRGGMCPASKPLLVECKAFTSFPRQSILPEETVRFPATVSGDDGKASYVGILVFGGLNHSDRADSIYLPIPIPTR